MGFFMMGGGGEGSGKTTPEGWKCGQVGFMFRQLQLRLPSLSAIPWANMKNFN